MEKMGNQEKTDNRKIINPWKYSTGWDFLLTGGILIIGLAETAHLAAVFLHWPFTRCAVLFGGLAGAAAIAAVLGCFLIKPAEEQEKKRYGAAEGILCMVLAGVLVSQLFFVCGEGNQYRRGDMTVETVESFLVSDGVYQVNPMTGMPYTEGLPSRLKILCLPTLYGSLCKVTSLSPRVVVWKIAPVITLLGCYAAFASLGNCLFAGKRDRLKRLCFLAAVSLLLWAGTYRYGMDGFNVLHCGWRGVAIRNGVLVPWLFSLCLRRKWLSAILCVLAEACIVWTLYGLGVCLFVSAGMFIVTAAGRKAPQMGNDETGI